MTNSADPDQLASSEANWSGSTLFAKTGHVVLSKRRVDGHLMQFSIYANFDRVYGQNHRRYWNIVDCFWKWNPKRSVSNNKFWNENFHFKICKKKAAFYSKMENWHLHMISNTWLQTVNKSWRKFFISIKKLTFFYRYPLYIIHGLWGIIEAILAS